jgi:hypothetical protein
MSEMNPRVVDNDAGEITVELAGRELRGWSYANDSERRAKMLAAREYVEGWSDARRSAVSVDQQLEQAGKAAIAIRNELDRTRVERDSWEAQFHSAAAAASEYSEFWEKHRSDFDQFGNYIPYSQMDGDLRAAKAEIERLRALPQTPLAETCQCKNPLLMIKGGREYCGKCGRHCQAESAK